MSVILTTHHKEIIKRLKRKALKIHLFLILLILGLLAIPYFYWMERQAIIENHETLMSECDTLVMRENLLQILRKRSLTIGQALDITEAVIGQKKVPIPMILAIIEQESGFRPEAISIKGARGNGQLMPIVWRTYGNGVNIHDPLSNITASINYLSDLYRANQDWKKTLRSYYGGPNHANDRSLDGYVRAVLAKAEKYERQIRR